MPRGTSQDCCCQYPSPHSKPRPLPPPASTGEPPHWQVGLARRLPGVTAPLPWGLVGTRLCCARTGFCVSPVVKARWPAKSSSLGIPMTSAGSPSWEACCGAQNLHNTGRTSLVELFSILWVAHLLGMEFDFIMIVSLLLSHCGFSFVFGCGGVFFWWVPASSCQLSNS